MIINATKLKQIENPPAIVGNFWYYKQFGGQDPRISLTYVIDGFWVLNIMVRSKTVYMSYSSTVEYQIYEGMMELIKQAQEILGESLT